MRIEEKNPRIKQENRSHVRVRKRDKEIAASLRSSQRQCKKRIPPTLWRHLPLTRAAGIWPLSWLKLLRPMSPLPKGDGPEPRGFCESRANLVSNTVIPPFRQKLPAQNIPFRVFRAFRGSLATSLEFIIQPRKSRKARKIKTPPARASLYSCRGTPL